ncbi:type VI secretion system baseplate subunit TssG, partial [Paraburkholderia solisilvae]
RSGAGALLALRRYLGVPAAQLEPLVGSWRKLLPVDRPLLGVRATTLGRDAVLGTHIWNQCAGVRLTVPDVDYPRLCALLPPRRYPAASLQGGTPTPAVDDGATQPQGIGSVNVGASASAGVGANVSADAGASTGVSASGGASVSAGASARANAGGDGHGAQETKPDAAAPVDGYAGLAQMVRLLFDRRVDCHVTLTIRTRDLPPPMLTGRVDQPLPGLRATEMQRAADATNATNADNASATAHTTRYAGLRLGQTAWLGTPRDAPDDERRAVMFTIIGDPQGVPA